VVRHENDHDSLVDRGHGMVCHCESGLGGGNG
jgi:hypothetical protein